MTETGTPTLSLNDNGSATYVASQSNADSLVFTTTVQSGQNAANLAVTGVNLPDGATIQDRAGNDAVLGGADQTFAGLQVDTTAPAITAESSASPSGPDIGTGKVVTFTIGASEAVVTAISALTLSDGKTAAYASGSGTAALTYSTTVAARDDTADLEATALTGVVTDLAGNPLDDGTFKAIDSGVRIDTVAPTASSPSDTVAQNSSADPIGIAAPTDAGTPAGSLAIVAGALPSDGTVTLADGTPVASGQMLSTADLIGLKFTPNSGAYDASSAFTYAVTDGAGNASTGTATLNVGAPGAPVLTGTATLNVGAPGAPVLTGTAAGQRTADERPVRPFASAALSDPNAGATDSLSITITGGGGTLTDGSGQSGLTRTGSCHRRCSVRTARAR